tara:strand:+ start:287 stop:514 length:228 start_codon:yes stop_codon:yes gene_type:complete
MADRRSSVYSCAAFARMSGRNLSRELPCIDYLRGETYYKQHKLYCAAQALQEDILRLQGCGKKYFDLHKQIYGNG